MGINWNNLSAKDIEAIKQKFEGLGSQRLNPSEVAGGSIFDQVRQEHPFEPEYPIARPGEQIQPEYPICRPGEQIQPEILPYRPAGGLSQDIINILPAILPHNLETISEDDIASIVERIKNGNNGGQQPSKPDIGTKLTPEQIAKIKELAGNSGSLLEMVQDPNRPRPNFLGQYNNSVNY